jgi:hypothetical protein
MSRALLFQACELHHAYQAGEVQWSQVLRTLCSSSAQGLASGCTAALPPAAMGS